MKQIGLFALLSLALGFLLHRTFTVSFGGASQNEGALILPEKGNVGSYQRETSMSKPQTPSIEQKRETDGSKESVGSTRVSPVAIVTNTTMSVEQKVETSEISRPNIASAHNTSVAALATTDEIYAEQKQETNSRLHPTVTMTSYRNTSASALATTDVRSAEQKQETNKIRGPNVSTTSSRNTSVSKLSKTDSRSDPGNHPETRDGRIIFFLHIHKSGGSSMCQSAKNNSEFVPTEYLNCLVQKNQKCCGGEDSLQAQVGFAAKTNYTFVAAEQGLYESLDPAHYHYMTVLRQSKSRYYSHFRFCCHNKHIIRLKGKVYNWTEWYTSSPDNYNMRMICGPDCHGTAKYQLTRQQFNNTLQRLQQFESILLLENIATDYERFCQQVGWKGLVSKVGMTGFNQTLPSEAIDVVMTPLDDALYEYALQLQSGIKKLTLSESAQARLDYYFEHGSDYQCMNSCCGECAPY